MYRYKLVLGYIGKSFYGSQKQINFKTVFGLLEDTLSKTLNHSIVIIPCGRTDSGVSAYKSVCHFNFNFCLNTFKIQTTLNNKLNSQGIIIYNLSLISSSFHSLNSCSSRQYSYFFSINHKCPSYLLNSVAIIPMKTYSPINNAWLKNRILGNKNFFHLCNKSNSNYTYLRNIMNFDFKILNHLSIYGERIVLFQVDISANGFLYRMIRHFLGLLVECMKNNDGNQLFLDYLCFNRPIKYNLAPPEGLHLMKVDYN